MKPCAPAYIPLTAINPLMDMAANMYGASCTQALLVFQGADGEYSAVFHREFQDSSPSASLHRYLMRSRVALNDLVLALLHNRQPDLRGVLDTVPFSTEKVCQSTQEVQVAQGQSLRQVQRLLAQGRRHRLCQQMRVASHHQRSGAA